MKCSASYRTQLFLLCLPLYFAGCDGDYLAPFVHLTPPVEQRFEHSMEYNNRNGYAEIQSDSEEYCIYVCSDTHVADDNSAVHLFTEKYRSDLLCTAACCLGDIVEVDYPHSIFVETIESVPRNPLKNDTMFVALGNHDIYLNQYNSFLSCWQTSTYYFSVCCPSGERDIYICLDSAQGTIGTAQLNWLRSVLQETRNKRYRHIIVYTHVNIFRRDNTNADISTLPTEETLELMSILSTFGVSQFWSGHDHSHEDFVHGGVRYIIVDSMIAGNTDAAYMIFHVNGSIIYNTFHRLYH